MDWLIAGGVLGLVAYFSIMLAAFYYLFFRPLLRKDDDTFSVIERGVLIGLLSGYMIHNFVVFDNIVSYIFYGSILAYIHSRVAAPVPKISDMRIDSRVVGQVVAPVVVLVTALIIYTVNVPSMQAAKDIIVAFRAVSQEGVLLADESLEAFDRALARESLGNQEIREQMTQRLQGALTSPDVPEATKERIMKRLEEELLKQLEEKPGDARVEVFISTFYRTIGDTEKAAEHLAAARDLSPRKQLIIFEQGFTELQRQDYEKALGFFKEAYDLGPQFDDARAYYSMALLHNDRFKEAIALLETRRHKEQFASNQFALSAAYQKKQFDLLIEMFDILIELKPQDPQARTNLSFILHEIGKTSEAIDVLRQAGEDIPSFKSQAEQFIASIKAESSPVPVQNQVEGPVQ
jgi:tetratricopeptide (TPR) repeat protein